MVVGGVPRSNAIAAGLTFCSGGCLTDYNMRALAGRVCPNCQARFDPKGGKAGRPQQYCSDVCRRDRERRYAKALRRLARRDGGVPRLTERTPAGFRRQIAEINEALEEYGLLWTRLTGRRPDGERGSFADEAALPVSPDKQLQVALSNMMQQLLDARHDAMAGEANEARREQEAKELTLLPGMAASRQAAQRNWWDKLAAAVSGADEPVAARSNDVEVY